MRHSSTRQRRHLRTLGWGSGGGAKLGGGRCDPGWGGAQPNSYFTLSSSILLGERYASNNEPDALPLPLCRTSVRRALFDDSAGSAIPAKGLQCQGGRRAVKTWPSSSHLTEQLITTAPRNWGTASSPSTPTLTGVAVLHPRAQQPKDSSYLKFVPAFRKPQVSDLGYPIGYGSTRQSN